MAADAIFAGDFHLRENNPAGWDSFFSFLSGPARAVPKLYLLGDVFHCWIGDDDQRPLARQAQKLLRTLCDTGVQVGFICGNHDFVVGAEFGRRTRVKVLGFKAVVTCAQTKILILHGDILCRKDLAFQRRRRFWTFPPVLACARRLPFSYRLNLAKRFMSARSKVISKDALEVDQDLAAKLMRRSKAHMMIHGHTHNPQIISNHGFVRAVVPAWPDVGGLGGWLELSDGKLKIASA